MRMDANEIKLSNIAPAQDLPVVLRDSNCLGIGFAMSFVSLRSLNGAFLQTE